MYVMCLYLFIEQDSDCGSNIDVARLFQSNFIFYNNYY